MNPGDAGMLAFAVGGAAFLVGGWVGYRLHGDEESLRVAALRRIREQLENEIADLKRVLNRFKWVCELAKAFPGLTVDEANIVYDRMRALQYVKDGQYPWNEENDDESDATGRE